MFSSFRSRLWLTYAFLIVTALLVVAIAFFVYLLNNPLVYRQTGQRLVAVKSVLLADQPAWSNLPGDQLQAFLAHQDELFDARLLVISQERQVIADSRAGLAPSFEPRHFFRVPRINQ